MRTSSPSHRPGCRAAWCAVARTLLWAGWVERADAEQEAAPERAGLPATVERLRALLARPTAICAGSVAPRSPREGTKQAQVLALLRRPEGASGRQIAAATSWAPHTVRGFLAGLASKGVRVAVLERVRQVEPDRQGVKGSYTVHHVAG